MTIPPDPAGRDLSMLSDWMRCWPYPLLLRRLFLWVDGRRVDARLAAGYPGASRDLALDPAPRLPPQLSEMAASLPEPADANAALQVALALYRHVLATHPGNPRRHSVAITGSVVRTPNGPSLSIPAAPRHGHQAGAPLDQRGEDVDRESHAGGDGDGDDARTDGTRDAPPFARRPLRQAASRLPSARQRLPAMRADGEGLQVATADTVEFDTGHRSDRLAAAPKEQLRVVQHDEWDFRARVHRRRWASVRERRVVGRDRQFLAELRARHPALLQQIRRQFARLQADERRRERRLTDGEHIDLDAAIDSFAERRGPGAVSDDRLYQSRPRRARDVSVALLLDMSGSTGYPIRQREPSTVSGEPELELLWQPAPEHDPALEEPRRRVIDVAKDAVGLLGEALQALGDRHAIFAFSGEGRHAVDFAVVRDFDDERSTAWGAALATIEPQGSTRTGAAVRHALYRLCAQPARRRIMIVLSDGYPQDSDYGPIRDDREYGLQDTAHALREAERAGVSTFNLSIDAGDTDYLRRMCPANRYRVVDDVETLPARLLALYRLIAASG